jgi:hypothetical protein
MEMARSAAMAIQQGRRQIGESGGGGGGGECRTKEAGDGGGANGDVGDGSGRWEP